MKPEIFKRLQALNTEFYQTFAEQFAEKRTRLQPGVEHALKLIPTDSNILDMGCGHGALAQHLIDNNHQGTYLGVDLSEEMINLARTSVHHSRVTFKQADLSMGTWISPLHQLPTLFQPPYSCVVAFASLHHIPGKDRREALVKEVFNLMKPGGHWILSVWDFLRSDRLRSRVVPWDRIGLDAELMEEGDYLIDWRHGGHGLRYVHHFSSDDLLELANSGGFDVVDSYRMDGENGQLGLYQVLQKQ